MKGLLKYCDLDRFVAIDLETTGLDPVTEEILEITAVRFVNGEPGEDFHSFAKPLGAVPPEITALTGIRDEDLTDQPDLDSVLESFLDFLGDDPVVVYHAGFAGSFLTTMLPGLANEIYEILPLAQMLYPTFRSHRRQAVLAFLEPDDKAPADDASATGRLFLRLLDFLAVKEVRTLRKASSLLRSSKSSLRFIFKSLVEYLQQNTVKSDYAPHVRPEYPVNVIGDTPKLNELEEDPRPVDERQIGKIFSAGGLLSQRFERYEERPQQIDMSLSCVRAFNHSHFLACEAGTGTGKSIAYLVPSILWSAQNRGVGEFVVVSTNTKNLQEQLFFKDLPLLEQVLEEPFKAVLLKGRNNYICMRKWEAVLQDPETRLTPWERERVLPLLFWVEETRTGDISENHGFQFETNQRLWRKLESESGYCTIANCREHRCPLLRIRQEAKSANIIVVNHSLLFSDLVSENAILGNYTNLVIDEAHNLEKTAAGYLGMEFNVWFVRSLLDKLYDKQPIELGTLPELLRSIPKGKLTDLIKHSLEVQVKNTVDVIDAVRETAEAFFGKMTGLLSRRSGGNGNSGGPRKERYKGSTRLFADAAEHVGQLQDELGLLSDQLGAILDQMHDLRSEAIEDQDEFKEALLTRRRECDGLANVLEFLVEAKDGEYVFWYELPWKEGSIDCRFFAVPLNVAQILSDRLYEKLNALILTSATLTVNRDFSYYNSRVGLDLLDTDQVNTLAVGSPFEYREQSLVGVAGFLPPPNVPSFTAEAVETIRLLAERYRRGTLVLFTSYKMMYDAANLLKQSLLTSGINLMVQGRDGSRTNLTSRFLSERESILFGTDSFWEGVDVPGEALELLILVKLPFDVPSEPIVAAKMEKIEAAGGKSFFEYSVPEAIIKFRQGFGRLIRSRSDRGVVLVFDERTISKRYGTSFLQALPAPSRVFKQRQAMFNQLDIFWQRQSEPV